MINFFKAIFKRKSFRPTIIDGQLSFDRDVLKWFKRLNLDSNVDIPFISSANNPCFINLLKNAPIKDNTIILGVCKKGDESNISHLRIIECDELDFKTKEILSNEILVVLE